MKYVIHDAFAGKYRAEDVGTLLTNDFRRAHRWTNKKAAEVAKKCYLENIGRQTKSSVLVVPALS